MTVASILKRVRKQTLVYGVAVATLIDVVLTKVFQPEHDLLNLGLHFLSLSICALGAVLVFVHLFARQVPLAVVGLVCGVIAGFTVVELKEYEARYWIGE